MSVWTVAFINVCDPTCAGLRLFSVDLQEDECREEQQPAVGPIRGLPHREPSALTGRVQDTAGAPDLGRRGKQGGTWGTGGGSDGCLRRSAGGGRHDGCLLRLSSACSAFFVLSTGEFSGDVSFALSTLTLIFLHQNASCSHRLHARTTSPSPSVLSWPENLSCSPSCLSVSSRLSITDFKSVLQWASAPIFQLCLFFVPFLLFLDLEVNFHLKPCSDISAFYIWWE